MADCNTNSVISGPGNINFLNSNYFKFDLGRIPDFTYFVQSASVPSLVARYANQPSNLGVFPKIPAGNYIFEPLEVGFNISANMKNWIDIYNWMKGIGNLKDDFTQYTYHGSGNSHVFSDASLIITNSAYSPISKIIFKYVFPISLGSLAFSTQNTSTNPVTCTVQFAYSYYELVSAGSTGPATS